jgi:hypothetical protein
LTRAQNRCAPNARSKHFRSQQVEMDARPMGMRAAIRPRAVLGTSALQLTFRLHYPAARRKRRGGTGVAVGLVESSGSSGVRMGEQRFPVRCMGLVGSCRDARSDIADKTSGQIIGEQGKARVAAPGRRRCGKR